MVTVSGKLVPSVVPSEELAPNVITVATGNGFVLILIVNVVALVSELYNTS